MVNSACGAFVSLTGLAAFFGQMFAIYMLSEYGMSGPIWSAALKVANFYFALPIFLVTFLPQRELQQKV